MDRQGVVFLELGEALFAGLLGFRLAMTPQAEGRTLSEPGSSGPGLPVEREGALAARAGGCIPGLSDRFDLFFERHGPGFVEDLLTVLAFRGQPSPGLRFQRLWQWGDIRGGGSDLFLQLGQDPEAYGAKPLKR